MTVLRVVLADQLSSQLEIVAGAEKGSDVFLLAEVMAEATYVRHHVKKIAFLFSAMRHFAEALRSSGHSVRYVALEDAENAQSLDGEILRAVEALHPTRVVITEPGEWRIQTMIDSWPERLGRPIETRVDSRFFSSRAGFATWAANRKTWRMEHFYREMRRAHGILVEDGKPVGGTWNFDAANRKRLPAAQALPPRRRFPPDEITRSVMALVERRFGGNFGSLDAFGWPVSRSQAIEALDDFVTLALPHFGDYQDAMRAGAPFLYHGLIAPALNLGLLDAEEVCRAAEARWREGRAPLNAVEGFVRQILGWREYVRGLYWARMPDYADTNALGATRDLPWFYWSGETAMACLAECVRDTRAHAHAHHIQRLMVLGNFALLAGLAPRQVEEWFLEVYADAYEWVELPNVHGMALWADGGLLGSKPYAASGAYIDRMSDYCRGCAYDVRRKSGPTACPFNYLYWNFLIAHEDRLRENPRLAMPYRTLATMAPARRDEIVADATRFLDSLAAGPSEGQPGRQGARSEEHTSELQSH